MKFSGCPINCGICCIFLAKFSGYPVVYNLQNFFVFFVFNIFSKIYSDNAKISHKMQESIEKKTLRI